MNFRKLPILLVLFFSLGLGAQDLKDMEQTACKGQDAECQQTAVKESDLKNPADKGTMNLVSAGASVLYMGGVLDGVLTLPAFMGDVAKICVSSGLMVAANVMAFMNAKGNGGKIEKELDRIKADAEKLKEKLENEELRRSKEFQIEVFDFYIMAMQRLRKISELRVKQHGDNTTYFSIAMGVGTAEAIIYSLPWSSNPPMAKCGAKSAIFAGIAIAMEKKGQKQAQKLMGEYGKREGILNRIKMGLMGSTHSLAKADESVNGPDRTSLGSDYTDGGDLSGLSGNGNGDISVTGSEYGCVDASKKLDQSCACAASNSCFKTPTKGWSESRYSAAFGDAGVASYIDEMNGAFAGKKTDPSSMSIAQFNARAEKAAGLRDRILADYKDKESKSKKKYRLGDKIGIASDAQLAAFLNRNFKRSDLDKMFADNPSIVSGSSSIDIGPKNQDDLVAATKTFVEKLETNTAAARGAGGNDKKPEEKKEKVIDLGLDDEDYSEELAGFDPKNIVLPRDVNYDYVGVREDVTRNNSANIFDIISRRYQLIYRKPPADL